MDGKLRLTGFDEKVGIFECCGRELQEKSLILIDIMNLEDIYFNK